MPLLTSAPAFARTAWAASPWPSRSCAGRRSRPFRGEEGAGCLAAVAMGPLDDILELVGEFDEVLTRSENGGHGGPRT